MEDLICRAKSDPAAFTELYRKYLNISFNYIFSRLNSRQEAEDLTAVFWETILKNISSLKSNEEPAFKAWFFTIARNIVYKHISKKGKMKIVSLEETAMDLPSNQIEPSKFLADSEDVRQIKNLIEILPQKQKEIFYMHFSADFKNKEIAEILNISEKTVASNLSRALATLRKSWNKLQ